MVTTKEPSPYLRTLSSILGPSTSLSSSSGNAKKWLRGKSISNGSPPTRWLLTGSPSLWIVSNLRLSARLSAWRSTSLGPEPHRHHRRRLRFSGSSSLWPFSPSWLSHIYGPHFPLVGVITLPFSFIQWEFKAFDTPEFWCPVSGVWRSSVLLLI